MELLELSPTPPTPGVVGVITNSTNSSPDWLACCVSRTCGSLMTPAYPLVHPLSRWVAAGHDLGRVVTYKGFKDIGWKIVKNRIKITNNIKIIIRFKTTRFSRLFFKIARFISL